MFILLLFLLILFFLLSFFFTRWLCAVRRSSSLWLLARSCSLFCFFGAFSSPSVSLTFFSERVFRWLFRVSWCSAEAHSVVYARDISQWTVAFSGLRQRHLTALNSSAFYSHSATEAANLIVTCHQLLNIRVLLIFVFHKLVEFVHLSFDFWSACCCSSLVWALADSETLVPAGFHGNRSVSCCYSFSQRFPAI